MGGCLLFSSFWRDNRLRATGAAESGMRVLQLARGKNNKAGGGKSGGWAAWSDSLHVAVEGRRTADRFLKILSMNRTVFCSICMASLCSMFYSQIFFFFTHDCFNMSPSPFVKFGLSGEGQSNFCVSDCCSAQFAQLLSKKGNVNNVNHKVNKPC